MQSFRQRPPETAAGRRSTEEASTALTAGLTSLTQAETGMALL